ncbi:MAG TPA: ferrous iron transporter B [Candidatus Cloacimonetes bacterium]|nr:ferrous iron transporter B [Candidatus Cloacimonadota bacterium]HEX38199.1 ferrous iron transporter B [Candidatus Cloacimonadota bacterium]
MNKILLIGNPNVGKSVIFSRLTGVNVIASNYPGTTVNFTKGFLRYKGKKVEVIDVPGTYSLDPSSRAEEVAVQMLDDIKKDDNAIIINVIDATNLERNLHLTLQLTKRRIPMIGILNFWDECKHTGVSIDVGQLQQELGIPIFTTCGITGEGIKTLVDSLDLARVGSLKYKSENIWNEIGNIINKTQQLSHRHHTLWERIGEASIHPIAGIPIAIIVLVFAFTVIRFIGEGIINYIANPIFDNLWTPLLMKLPHLLGGAGFFHDILLGKLIDGQIAYVESLGLLSTGLYVPLAMVLPYIIAFYFILSFMEDSGYLPRLGVLVDNLMHKLGLHGLAIIPMLLGLGCNVPGALATRVLETRRERFIAATLMAIAVPCMAQIAMIFGLVGSYGVGAIAIVFGTLFIVWIVLGLILKKIIKGESPEIFVEIPAYRFPYIPGLFKKVWMRVFWFVKEAVPFVIVGVLIVNILYFTGFIQFIGRIAAPFIHGIFGLPQDAIGALIVGFLRKDVAVGMLIPLELTRSQMIIASVVLTMYFPCIATFTVLVKELGLKDMFKSAGIMLTSTAVVGGILNLVL